MNNMNNTKNSWAFFALFAGLFFAVGDAMADTNMTIGSMASQITDSFTALTKLITAGSYLAGLGFSIGAIMKFKQHKDNPQQTPIGQPIGLLFIAVALLFLPNIIPALGNTAFSQGGSTAGPEGTEITGS